MGREGGRNIAVRLEGAGKVSVKDVKFVTPEPGLLQTRFPQTDQKASFMQKTEPPALRNSPVSTSMTS